MNQRAEPTTSNGLAIVPDKPPSAVTTVRPVELMPSQAAWQQMNAMAIEIYKSGLMPDGIKNSSAVLATALKGYELGVPFMAAIEGIHIIKGKVSIGAHLMLGLVKRAYGGQAIRVAETDLEHCTIEYREPGWEKVSRFMFSIEDARRAGLVGGDNWKKYPAAMLRARAISAAGKLAFPEVVGGLYVAGELGDAVVVTEDGDVVPDLRANTATVVDQPPDRNSPPPAPRTAPAPRNDVQDAEYRPVAQPAAARAQQSAPVAEMTWPQLFDALKPLGLRTKNGIAAHLGRGIEGLSPAEVDALLLAGGVLDAYNHDPTTLPIRGSGPASPTLSDAQNRKLHAQGKQHFGADGHTILHALAAMNYGVESVSALTTADASHLIDILEQPAVDVDGIRAYVAETMRQEAIDRGQPELPIAGTGEPTADEADLINFQERAEAARGGDEWDALIGEAGADTVRLVILAEASATIGRLDALTDAVKQGGRYNQAFITAERKVRPGLAARAEALTR